MRSASIRPFWIATLLGFVGIFAGCQDGPIPENRVLNPWARKQWAEDEKFGPTYYKRLEELAAIRAKASGLAEADRDRLAQEIVDCYGLEPSPAMRCELVRTLAYLPAIAARTGIATALADEDPDVRTAACQGLSRLQGEESLALLAQAAEADENLDVRIAAVRSLGTFRDPAVLQSLGTALEDSDPAIQKVAIESLQRNTGRDFGPNVPAWKEYLAGGNPTRPQAPSLAERLSWPWF